MPAYDANFPNPEWLICGIQLPTGNVRLIASKELTRVDLKVDYGYAGIYGLGSLSLINSDMSLTTHMRAWVLIEAPDYATALKRLFETWSPDTVQRGQITQGQPQLEE